MADPPKYFRYTCPHCGMAFSAQPVKEVTVVKCPTCQQRTSITAPRPKAPPPPPEQTAEVKAPPQEAAPPSPPEPAPPPRTEEPPVQFPTWDDQRTQEAIEKAVKALEGPMREMLEAFRRDMPRQAEEASRKAVDGSREAFLQLKSDVRHDMEAEFDTKMKEFQDRLRAETEQRIKDAKERIQEEEPRSDKGARPAKRKSKEKEKEKPHKAEQEAVQQLLVLARQRVDEAERLKIETADKVKLIQEAERLMEDGDTKTSELILKGVIDSIIDTITGLEKAIEKLRGLKPKLDKAQQAGVDVQRAKELFSKAEPALRNRDYRGALEWANKAELALQEARTEAFASIRAGQPSHQAVPVASADGAVAPGEKIPVANLPFQMLLAKTREEMASRKAQAGAVPQSGPAVTQAVQPSPPPGPKPATADVPPAQPAQPPAGDRKKGKDEDIEEEEIQGLFNLT